MSYGSRTGYDLEKIFDCSVRHFWPARQSQIYRTLTRLAEHGLVDVEVLLQESRPDRRIHSLTKSGRRDLHGWIPSPRSERSSRVPFPIFFAGTTSDDEAIAVLEANAKEICGALDS